MKNIKYIALSFLALGILSCENETVRDSRDRGNTDTEPLPELSAGTADFSNYVSLGASFTAGFTDNALFIASQENSFPNIISNKFANAGGGTFTQPMMSDNFGGLAAGGTRITQPRFVFGGAGPVPLETVIGPVTVGTDIVLNNPTGPFNNLGIPGAKSFHLVAPGYGNLSNFPAAANPYAVRVTGNAPNATIVELAVMQSPSFFTLSEFGGNDVLGYATSGGDGSNPITPTATFDAALNATVGALVSTGAKGAIGNLPDITSLSFFTAVPHNTLDPSALGAQLTALNTQLYGPLDQIFTAFGEPDRVNLLSATAANPVLINDENAADRSAQITGALTPLLGAPTAAAFGAIFGKCRQATANDLVLLTAAGAIGTVVAGIPAPVNVNGVSYPLADNFVLTPEEQMDIATATQAYNSSLATAASSNGLALVDLNSILVEASTTGIMFDDYNMNTDLVFGGLVSLDGVHLTARGYALMANSFLEAIDATYGSNFAASGNLAKAGDFPTNYSPTMQ